METLVKVLMLLIGVGTIIFQIYQPVGAQRIASLIFFLGLLGYIFLLYVFLWIGDKVKSYLNKIAKNSKDISEIKELLSMEKRFTEIDKRIAILEALKSKTGKFSIHPLWIAIVILIVLFYLYLRSLGFF